MAGLSITPVEAAIADVPLGGSFLYHRQMAATVDELRKAWDKAIENDKPQKAATALAALEIAEPRNPQWPHRLGDAYRRIAKTKDAEGAYERAMRLYQQQGFVPRAVALAKIIVGMNPARASILESIDQDPARSLRRRSRPPPTRPINPQAFASPKPALRPEALRATATHPPPHGSTPPSFIAEIPVASLRLVAAAPSLHPAKDAAHDEVRFANVAEDEAIELDVADLEPISVVASTDIADEPSAERLSLMSASTLFAEVTRDALVDLTRAAELIELPKGDVVFKKGDEATALYVLVLGRARVELSEALGGGVDLCEGEVFGEGCLLEHGARNATVRASAPLTVLRITKTALDTLVKKHTDVGNVLFDLLIQRLITNTIQASPLFSAFDPPTRRELARLFEIRRASAGVVVMEFGKRSDGLYVVLAGDLKMQTAQGEQQVPLGSTFGHESLLSPKPAVATVKCNHEAVLLRLPASRFTSFAMEYPPALAHLAELRG